MARKSRRINSSPFLKLFLIAAVVVVSAAFLTYQKAGVLGTSTQTATQTKSNSQGTVTVSSQNTNSSGKLYSVGASDGDFCLTSPFQYKVNGLTFTSGQFKNGYPLCPTLGYIRSTANCNTFSMVPPNGAYVSGIGYQRLDKGIESFRYIKGAKSVRLCDYQYFIYFTVFYSGA